MCFILLGRSVMNIQPNSNNISMHGKFSDRIMQKVLDALPSKTVKESAKKLDKWKKIDDIISRPAENRAILGATALVTQPLIDSYNPKVDEETRTVSRNRTIAKIIAGAGVGVFVVRGPLYKLIVNMTNLKGKSKYSKFLIPKKSLSEISSNEEFLKHYRSALSMGLVLIANCVTNFVLDAPLTIFLTNKLNKQEKEVKRG